MALPQSSDWQPSPGQLVFSPQHVDTTHLLLVNVFGLASMSIDRQHLVNYIAAETQRQAQEWEHITLATVTLRQQAALCNVEHWQLWESSSPLIPMFLQSPTNQIKHSEYWLSAQLLNDVKNVLGILVNVWELMWRYKRATNLSQNPLHLVEIWIPGTAAHVPMLQLNQSLALRGCSGLKCASLPKGRSGQNLYLS